MPTSSGGASSLTSKPVRRSSFKLSTPVFTSAKKYNNRAPPIHALFNSSGESTGGSSEASSIDDCSIVSGGGRGSGLIEEVLGCPRRLRRNCSLSSISSLSGGGSFDKCPCHSADEDDQDNSEGKNEDWKAKPYQVIMEAMETDPKWRSERNIGRMVGMYRVNGEIGTGNFAKVRLGVHQLIKEKVAVKIIDKTRIEPKLEKMLGREVSCMESLYHPNIVRLYEVIETPSKLYLISEWAPAGDLYAKVTLRARLSESEAKPIFRQILSALTYMHSNGIIHRDLKAENIFFSTGTHCKVGDFGFATIAHKGQLLSTFCGSPPYAAPELFRDEHYEGSQVDIWAFGVLLFFMIEGCLPFIGTSIPSLKSCILQGHYDISPTVSLECLDLIQGILQQKPRNRLTLSQIIRHPWLQVQRHTNTHELIRRQDTVQLLLPSQKNRALSKTVPTRDQVLYGLLSPQELKALEILKEIGISEEIIERHRSRGARSHVVGIYRIILHKLQEGLGVNTKSFLYLPQALDLDEEKPQGLPVPGSSSRDRQFKGTKIVRNNRSPRGYEYVGKNGKELRKQFAYDYQENVQQSSTCHIL